ncbi:MAG: bifunctional serine/threonine-protein kinase/universal stress protein [bacterium]
MRRPYSGMEIDGFTLGERLHQGGFATIWAVTHALHRTALVMKVPTILDGYDGPTIVGFEVEQMIMPRLTGVHVPKVCGVGGFDDMPYIVMEAVAGGALVERFGQPWTLSDLVETAARMAGAVHDLHVQGVAHLDLKPGNILQRATGEMVLIDFGLARHDDLPDLLAEEFTIPMGTYPYIAPEQFLRQRDDLRSDIFALGAMIYEMAVGHAPFGVPETLKGARRRLWRDPVPPRSIRPDLPEWVQEVILRALEVDPSRRYQTAAQLLFDLQHPGQVVLTARGRKLRADEVWVVWRRWWRMRRVHRFAPPVSHGEVMERAPILLVAVDLSPDGEALAPRLMLWVRRMLSLQPDSRIAVVNVIKSAVLGLDQTTDDAGENLHVVRLVALRAWGAGLDLAEAQLTFSVLESSDPAAAIIDHAAQMRADHILMGARGHSTTRRYLGSVSAHVVAEAACSVTVIRNPAIPNSAIREPAVADTR